MTLKVAMYNMSRADSDLEKTMTMCPGKDFPPYYKLYDKMKRASIFKTFDGFIQINNPLI